MKTSARLGCIVLSLGAVLALAACSPSTPDQNQPAVPTSQVSSPSRAIASSSAQTSPASGAFANKVSNAALLSGLQAGGYVIYVRHGKTDKTSMDQLKPVMSDCKTQKALSDAGKQQAVAIGKAFTDLKIPVGNVYASELCRAWQMAQLAFGRYEKKAALDTMPLATPTQVAAIKQKVVPFLTTAPVAGTNTVIVAHDDIFQDATGIYPQTPGMAYVIQPNGKGGYAILASLLAEDWAKLGK